MLAKMAKKLLDIFNVGNNYNSANANANTESQPIVVSLTSTGGPFSNVAFLYANKNAVKSNYGLPNIPATNSGITAQTGSAVDYGQFLQILRASTFRIKKIVVISNNSTLLRSPLKIQQYDITDKVVGDTIFINKNIFQVATNQIEVPVNLVINKMTEITIGTFPANTNVEFRFYPDQTFSNFSKQENKQYSVPWDTVLIYNHQP